jgi:mannosyl-oligosaccharide alpha-1,2-mannosidase
MRVSTMSMSALAAASQAAALSQADRAAAVKNTFQIAWDGYYKHAFPHDQLHPLDNTSDDGLYVVLLVPCGSDSDLEANY